MSVLTSALFDQIKQTQQGVENLYKKPVFQKLFGNFENKKAVTKKTLNPRVEEFINKIENDKVVVDKYEGLNDILKLLPELDVNSRTAMIDIAKPIYQGLIKSKDFNLKAFIKSHYNDDNNIISGNNLSGALLLHPLIHQFVKNNDIFKNNDELEEEGKDIEMINSLKEIYQTNKPEDFLEREYRFNEFEEMKNKNEALIEKNEELDKIIDEKNDMIKAGGKYFWRLGQKQDETNKKIDDLKKTIYDDQSDDLSVYSHLMNNRKLNRIHSFLNRGYGDMTRDEAIRKITKDLEFDDNFKYLDEKDRIKQAETLADAIFIRKEELSQKYRPVYEKLRALNDLNMIKNLPEEAAKDLNQYDLEKYYADQKRIDKIYILPREWKRVSAAATQYNINPMLFRGIIKE